MNTPRNSVTSWIKFALFELFCLIVCFIVVGSALKLGVFNDEFIRSGGLWKATSALFGFWFVLSGAALVHYLWRMELGTLIFTVALIAAPFSTLAFCAGYKNDADAAFLAFLSIVSTILGLGIALGIVKAAGHLEEKIYPLFRLMGF